MARKAIYNYIFTPGASTVGKVIIPDPYKLGDILMITNVTRNTVIYNFGDPSRGGTITYTNATTATEVAPTGGNYTGSLSAGQAVFSNLSNGYSTIFLAYDTSSPVAMSANDVLQIYVETSELKIRPYDFGIDAVERMKVGTPQSLIDADFEYGMQPTKWVQFATMNDVPTVYEQPGTDAYLGLPAYTTFIAGTSSLASTWISNPAQTNFNVMNTGWDGATPQLPTFSSPGTLSQNGPRAFNNQYAMVIAQGQAGQPNCAAGTTAITNLIPIMPQFGGVFQRTFTVANTAGWSPGDIACVVEMPGEGLQQFFTALNTSTSIPIGSNVQATVLPGFVGSAGNTTMNANVATLNANSIILVETSQYGIWEAMNINSAYTGQTAGAAFTVHRNLWGTNSGNATILAGARIRQIAGNVTGPSFFSNANVELMRIDSVDSVNQFTVTRSWFNTNASPTFGANSIVFKVNHTANGTIGAAALNSANVEIIKVTLANASTGGAGGGGTAQIASRGQLGTTALSTAGPGSLYVQLTGMFFAGNTSQPRVLAYAPNHGISNSTNANVGTAYVSTVGSSQAVTVSNVEGIFNNTLNIASAASAWDPNYIQFFPKLHINQLPGYQINLNDTQSSVRKGGIYSGANIIVANVTANAGSPALITISTLYPHGILPGHVIQSQIINVNGVVEAATGQFVVTNTPNPNSFSYVAKANLVANTTGTFGLTANVTMFPTGLVKHRFIDGGNNIGTNTPSHGYEMTRQTKKYFRYQSGKGIMFTSGTQFNPVFTPANVSANVTAVASNALITVVVENEHGLQPGANVTLYGFNTSGYNNYYTVNSVIANNGFTIFAKSDLGATIPAWTKTSTNIGTAYQTQNFPRVVITNWHGSKIRSGIFDDANGVFFEYDGATFWAVKRSSTNDMAGRVNIAVNSNYVIGNPDTRFVDQMTTGDQIVIRGMTHTVVQVVDQTHMYIQPVYRGTVNAQDARYTKIQEERTPQKFFNLDRVDGTGASGYVMNLAKMQMIGIQYTWYGAGFVDYMVRAIDGKFVFMHRSKGNNINDEAYMRTGNLPARYQASNKAARSWLSKAVNASATEIQIYDVTEFPVASVTTPITVQIDNEFVRYTSGPFAANGNIAGLTRGASITSFILGQNRTFYAGSNAGTSGWQEMGLATNNAWSAQAYNPNTGTWVAISGYSSSSAVTGYSKDGHTWTQGGNLPSSSGWVSLAYGRIITGTAFRDYFVAVSNTSGTDAAYSFDDGLTWTSASLSATAQWSSVVFALDQNNVGTFVAIAGLNSASTATSRVQPTASNFGSWGAGGALTTSQMWTSAAFGRTSANTINGRSNYICCVGSGASMTTATTVMNYSTDGGTTWLAGAVQSATYGAVAFGNNTWMAVPGGYAGTAGTAASYIHGNPASATWSAMTMATSGKWRSIVWNPYAIGSSQGGWVAVAETLSSGVTPTANFVTNPGAITQGVAPTWGAVTLPFSGTWTSVAAGQGMFSAIQDTAAVGWGVAVSYNGAAWVSPDLPITPAAANPFGNIAYGAGNAVAIGVATTSVLQSFNGGKQWTTAPGTIASAAWSAIAYGPSIGLGGAGRFVAIAGGGAGATTTNWNDAVSMGSNWTAGGATTASANWSSLCFVNGAFVAVANASSTLSNFSSNGAISWSAVTLPSAQNWSSVDGGYFPSLTANSYAVAAVSATTGQVGAFSNVVIGTTGASTLSLWGQSTLPVSANWTSVAYGIVNNVAYFVAVSGNNSGSGATAYSTDGGRTWTAGGALPAGLLVANALNRVIFGTNGVWLVLSNVPNVRGTAAAYSVDNGITWAAVTMPSSQNWINGIYARDYSQFVAISADQTNISSNVAVSVTTGGLAQAHTANTGVRVVSVSASPDLNHWGSAVILDGGFTVDRTYTFTYNVANFAATGTQHGTTTAGLPGAPNTVFMMRLAPTISSSLTGELGVKDLINRAQVLLQNMYINIASTGARFLLQGVLNPTNIASANWRPLNNAANFLQPSFTQFVANNIGVFGSGASPNVPNITYTTGNAATGGEQLFSIPVSQGTAGFLDLSLIKEITGMVLPGTGTYPNGNEVLAINLVPAGTVGAASATGSNVDIQITFVESQA